MTVRGLLPDEVRCALREIGEPATAGMVAGHLDRGGRGAIAWAAVEELLVDLASENRVRRVAHGERGLADLWEPIGFDIDGREAAAASVMEWVCTRPDEVRVLAAFVECMQAELASNSGKGDRPGWMRAEPAELLAEVHDHAAKLHIAARELDRRQTGATPRAMPWDQKPLEQMVREFAADTANMAMMLADLLGVLHVPVEAGARG